MLNDDVYVWYCTIPATTYIYHLLQYVSDALMNNMYDCTIVRYACLCAMCMHINIVYMVLMGTWTHARASRCVKHMLRKRVESYEAMGHHMVLGIFFGRNG